MKRPVTATAMALTRAASGSQPLARPANTKVFKARATPALSGKAGSQLHTAKRKRTEEVMNVDEQEENTASPPQVKLPEQTTQKPAAPADNSAPNNCAPSGDVTTEGEWSVKTSRNTSKKVANAQRELEAFKQRVNSSSNGVFCIGIAPRVERVVEGVTVFEADTFKEGILPVCAELHRLFPFSRPMSKNGRIQVWTNTVEEAKQVLGISRVLDTPVLTRCSQIDQNWARLTKVDRGFSNEDILSALSNVGVIEARREMTKRRLGNDLSSVATDRVLLKFSGVPPSEVALAGRAYRVVLYAGAPLTCYNCQRLGHRAANCTNKTACRRCGSSKHMMTECTNNPRCANCGGAHLSTAAQCPLRACEIEKRKIQMENRVVQQLRFSHPAAPVEAIDYPPLPTTDSNEASGAEPAPADPGHKSYAAAVRAVIVSSAEGAKIQVNLPGHTMTANTRKKRSAPRVSGPKTKKQKKAAKPMTGFNFTPEKIIQPILRVLDALCPEAAQSLRQLLSSLGPWLNVLRGFPGNIAV